MRDVVGEQDVDLGGGEGPALRCQAALDQPPDAAADHAATLVRRDRREALALEQHVERADQVGRRVDERAVEVEDDGEHGVSRSGGASRAQAFGPVTHRDGQCWYYDRGPGTATHRP